MMQTNSTHLLLNNNNTTNNNNNNVSTKNLQAAASTDGGQFIFKSSTAAAVPNHNHHHHLNHQQPQQQLSMSPALGGSASTTATAGLVTMTKTLNQGGTATPLTTTTTGQSITPAMLPGVQIVNMRSGAPTTIQPVSMQQQQQQQQQQHQVQQHQQQAPQLTGQRTVATVQPRVVIGSQNVMTGNRPASNSLQLAQGQTLLLKTDTGQFQLLRMGTAPAGAGGVQHTTLTTNATGLVTTGAGSNQTIRLQTMPAVSRFTTTTTSSGGGGVTGAGAVVQATCQVHLTRKGGGVVAHLQPQSQQQQQAPQQQQQQLKRRNSTPTSNIVLTSNAVTSGAPTLISASSGQPIASVPPVAVASSSNPASTTSAVVVTSTPQHQQQQQNTNQQNTKEKCRKFLANLLDLSSREPKSVEKNVRTLIQELIDNAVEPEGFCNRLERLLNASPQPCLIGFLKKSLPVLRQSLVRKELTIEGIKPPPHNVAFPTTATTIPAMVRPVGQSIIPRIGLPRPGQTTITRHAAPVRIGTAPRLAAVNQLRPVSTIPALQPVQLRTTNATTIRPAGMHQTTANVTKVVKMGQTQIKQISGPTQTTTISGNQLVINRTPGITTITQRPAGAGTVVTGGTTVVNTINSGISNAGGGGGGGVTTITGSPAIGTSGTASAAAAAAAAALKERKAASFYQHNSISSSSIYGDDEINDVAAMGGVNLAEESQRILGSTELIGTQIRSCKDEVFLHLPALQSKIRAIVARHGLEEASSDVAVLVSHAAQERLKNIVEKLAVIAEHRVDVIKIDPRYEVTKDVRGQIKFLEELDKAEQKRHEEQEREMLLRAAKSRAKTEDPEQAKLKAKAKEMQRAEMEELRQRDANLTALQAIGQRKKPRLDGDAATTTTSGSSGTGSGSGFSTTSLRPRLKRVNLRDMIFYLEQERETCRSTMLYRAYLK